MAKGYLLMCPMVPDQMVGDYKELAKRRVIEAAILAKKKGAKIIGLAGFTSIITNQGLDIKEKVDIAVTSGNTYTATLAIDAILEASQIFGVERKDVVSIIGATGDIGSACAKVLADYFENLILVGRNAAALDFLAAEIKSRVSSSNVKTSVQVRESVRNSKLILTVTSATSPIVSSEDLSAGAILCDVSYPPNIDWRILNDRRDVFIFEGGIAANPWFNDLNDFEKEIISIFNFKATLHGCAAETILLCFNGNLDLNFCLGSRRISAENIEFMRGLGKRHGIRHADFYAGEKKYSGNEILQFQKNGKL